MKVGCISIFPQLIEAALAEGVVGRAVRELIEFDVVSPRDFTLDERRTIDDRPFGGGPGMVMMREPLCGALDSLTERFQTALPVILLTPDGMRFDQRRAEAMAQSDGFILVAGRYEGIDQRFIDDRVDEELSVGDFVLSGGEFAALVVLDAVLRLIPGALGNADSIKDESFMDGRLDYPHYTRPSDGGVPPTLMSGNHASIDAWRHRKALERTFQKRPDLLLDRPLDETERRILKELFQESSREREENRRDEEA